MSPGSDSIQPAAQGAVAFPRLGRRDREVSCQGPGREPRLGAFPRPATGPDARNDRRRRGPGPSARVGRASAPERHRLRVGRALQPDAVGPPGPGRAPRRSRRTDRAGPTRDARGRDRPEKSRNRVGPGPVKLVDQRISPIGAEVAVVNKKSL